MAGQKIKHVFILMLENHSFDNIFGLSGIAGINGLTGNESNAYMGTAYPVKTPAPDTMPSDPGHEFLDTLQQLCGYNDISPVWKAGSPYPPADSSIDNLGFVANYATSVSEQTKVIHYSPPPVADIGDVMCCFDTAKQLPATYELATRFAVCDNWFASIPGPTWPNRFFAYAASSAGLDDSPSGKDQLAHELLTGYQFPHGTVFDLLTKHNLSFRLYQDRFTTLSFPIVHALEGIHWRDMHDISSFATDLQNNYDHALTLIEPNYGDIFLDTYRGGSSQHPMDGMQKGEALIKTVYEAIYNSPLWENSLLIITYDEHGGFYDHVAPPAAIPPGDGGSKYNQHGFDFSHYGVRVPAIVVSPYIPANTVSHTLFDHSSMIKTVTDNWGLPSLTDRDTAANGLSDLLSLSEPRAKADCPATLSIPNTPEIPGRELTEDEQKQFGNLPIPASGNIIGFLQVAAKIHHELGTQTDPEKSGIQDAVKNIETRTDARNYINSVLAKLKQAKEDITK